MVDNNNPFSSLIPSRLQFVVSNTCPDKYLIWLLLQTKNWSQIAIKLQVQANLVADNYLSSSLFPSGVKFVLRNTDSSKKSYMKLVGDQKL